MNIRSLHLSLANFVIGPIMTMIRRCTGYRNRTHQESDKERGKLGAETPSKIGILSLIETNLINFVDDIISKSEKDIRNE